jgi:hypothetical protein
MFPIKDSLRFSNSFFTVKEKSIGGIEVLELASKNCISLDFKDYYFNLN